MRIVLQTPCRETHLLQEGGRSGHGLLLAGLTVQDHRLRDLFPDTLHGIQCMHRALEDDRGLGPPDRTEASGRHLQNAFTVQQHLSLDLGAGREQAKDGPGDRGLAAA